VERVNEGFSPALWLLTDRELKILFVATGCLTKKEFERHVIGSESYGVTYQDSDKLWNLIDDTLKRNKPDEAS